MPDEQSAKRLRVLVVEDDPDSAECLAILLETTEGIETRVALNGFDALAIADAFTPDLVIVDIGLPGLDGFKLARHLRAEKTTKDSALIALSGYSRPEDQKRGIEAGFDIYLAKPPNFELLQRLIAQVAAQGRRGLAAWLGRQARPASS
jgi:DNA-binding response OmpR family regulator